jgi:hypothetical protein
MALLISAPAAESYPQNLGMGLWALVRKPLSACSMTSAPKFLAVSPYASETEDLFDRVATDKPWIAFRKCSGQEKGGIREEVDAADYSGSVQGGGENRSRTQDRAMLQSHNRQAMIFLHCGNARPIGIPGKKGACASCAGP